MGTVGRAIMKCCRGEEGMTEIKTGLREPGLAIRNRSRGGEVDYCIQTDCCHATVVTETWSY